MLTNTQAPSSYHNILKYRYNLEDIGAFAWYDTQKKQLRYFPLRIAVA